MPISVAIIGAGPAGFYTAEALLDKNDDARIDTIERLPTPFGLIRAGVAPDHQSTKQVAKKFERTALRELVHFYGNVDVGQAVSLTELCDFYDAVVLATGAGVDRQLGIPGEELAGIYGSASFVGWYNGHPDFRWLNPRLEGRRAVVIGNGNVALDVARVLVKSAAEMATSDLPGYAGRAIRASGIEDVYIVGRRAAAYAKWTATELREIGELADCEPMVDARDVLASGEFDDQRDRRVSEKNLSILRRFASFPSGAKPKRLHFRFHLAPVEIEGETAIEAVRVREGPSAGQPRPRHRRLRADRVRAGHRRCGISEQSDSGRPLRCRSRAIPEYRRPPRRRSFCRRLGEARPDRRHRQQPFGRHSLRRADHRRYRQPWGAHPQARASGRSSAACWRAACALLPSRTGGRSMPPRSPAPPSPRPGVSSPASARCWSCSPTADGGAPPSRPPPLR